MKTPRARPRFMLELRLPPEVAIERIRKHLAVERRISGAVLGRTVVMTVSDADAHFWSPHLDVHVEDAKDGGSILAAMFTPHPQIWTSFIAVQALFALFSLGAFVWLTSALILGQDLSLAAASLGGMLFGGGFAYGAAYVGQGLGSEQMYLLRAFVEAALRDES